MSESVICPCPGARVKKLPEGAYGCVSTGSKLRSR